MAKYGKGKKACYDCGGPIMRHGGNPEFDKAFAKARKAGQSTFTWNGEKYNTETAELIW